MSLDTSVISGMSSDSFNQALEFLASEENGLGGMVSRFQEFSDPVDGYILSESRQLDSANERYSKQIERANERIGAMQASLMAKLQAADALLASMESQRSMLDATIESLNTVTNGKRPG
jgi:flagellar capping protein FliD